MRPATLNAPGVPLKARSTQKRQRHQVKFKAASMERSAKEARRATPHVSTDTAVGQRCHFVKEGRGQSPDAQRRHARNCARPPPLPPPSPPPPLPKTSFLQRPDKTFPLHLLHGFPPLAAGVGDIGIHPAAHATAPLRPPGFSAETFECSLLATNGKAKEKKAPGTVPDSDGFEGAFSAKRAPAPPAAWPGPVCGSYSPRKTPALPATRSPLRGGRLRKARNDWGGGGSRTRCSAPAAPTPPLLSWSPTLPPPTGGCLWAAAGRGLRNRCGGGCRPADRLALPSPSRQEQRDLGGCHGWKRNLPSPPQTRLAAVVSSGVLRGARGPGYVSCFLLPPPISACFPGLRQKSAAGSRSAAIRLSRQSFPLPRARPTAHRGGLSVARAAEGSRSPAMIGSQAEESKQPEATGKNKRGQRSSPSEPQEDLRAALAHGCLPSE